MAVGLWCAQVRAAINLQDGSLTNYAVSQTTINGNNSGSAQKMAIAVAVFQPYIPASAPAAPTNVVANRAGEPDSGVME